MTDQIEDAEAGTEAEAEIRTTPMPWVLMAIASVVAAAVAVWAVTPTGEADGPVRWRTFQAPDVLQIIALGDAQVAANVQAAGPRIMIKAPVQLVFRDVDDATAIEVASPKGRVTLALAEERVAATVTKGGIGLQVGEERAAWRAEPDDDGAWRDALVRLDVVGGMARVSVDGAVVAELAAAEPLEGRTWVHAFANSSFDAVAAERATGERRSAQPDGADDDGRARQIWAGLAAAFAVIGMVVFLRRLISDRRGTALAPDIAPVSNIYGVLVALVLMAGVWVTLGAQNRERLEPPLDVATVATDVWTLEEPCVVERGKPFFVDRRDGNFVFEAEVTLEPSSALDIVLRGAPIERDRSFVISLSTDARMPCGLHRNLGTSWTTADADNESLTLPPTVSHTVRVTAEQHLVSAWVGDELLGSLDDLELRVGRTAFLALRGQATIQSAKLAPQSEARPLDDWLWGERTAALGWILAGVLLLALVGWRDFGAVVWLFPLAIAAWPDARLGFVVAVVWSVTLAALWPEQRRRVTTWLAGAVVIWATWVGLTEAPEPFSPSILNALNLDDIHGAAVPPAYAWARHPLARRFNGYVRTQSFRGGKTRFDASGATRIIAVGSSSTFGYGVGDNETFAAQLDRRLGHRAQVLNAGVPGGHAERFVSFVENVLVDLEPDVLIITLGYNDHIQGARYDERAHFAAMTTDGIGPLGRLRAAYSLWSRSRASHRFVRGMEEGTADPEDIMRFQTEPAARFAESIEDMTRIAQEAGIAVMLVQEPIRPGENKPVLAAFHAALADVAARTGAHLVATQPALDDAGPDVYLDIVHPDPTGHRIIAAELAAALVDAGLVAP